MLLLKNLINCLICCIWLRFFATNFVIKFTWPLLKFTRKTRFFLCMIILLLSDYSKRCFVQICWYSLDNDLSPKNTTYPNIMLHIQPIVPNMPKRPSTCQKVLKNPYLKSRAKVYNKIPTSLSVLMLYAFYHLLI